MGTVLTVCVCVHVHVCIVVSVVSVSSDFLFFILVSEFIVRDIPEISGVLGTLLSAVQC